MQIIYVLPKQTYFSQGRRGRVAHAIGVASGLSANGANVSVLSGPGTVEAMKHTDVRCIEVEAVGSGFVSEWRWLTRVISRLEEELERSSVDAVLVRYAVSNGFRFMRVFRKNHSCLTCFEVNSLAYHQYHTLPEFVRSLFMMIERRILRAADMNNAVSSTLSNDLGGTGQQAPKIALIPNAADPRNIPTTNSKDDGTARVRFIYMGVFQPYYELDLVVESFSLLKQRGIDAELHLYGDGPQYDAIEAMTESDADVSLYGRYDLDELLKTGVFDGEVVLLLPNRGSGMSEIGSPIKFYEYMSFGQAILASQVGQAWEVLESEKTCLFYEPGNIESCSAAMQRLAEDKSLRQELGQNVLSGFLANHTWRARMKEFLHELRQVNADSGNA